MLRTLFHIPDSLAGLPVFGFGVLFVLWLVASVGVMAYLVKRQGWTSETQSYLPVLMVIGVVIAFVLPALTEPGGVPIRGYGVLLLLAVVSGVGLCVYRARQMRVNPDVIYSLAFWMFIGGMLGARLFYIIEYWHQFQRESLTETLGSMLNVAQGGLVVYGSLIGALIAFTAFVRRRKLPALALADLIAPGMALGLCLGRIGCLLNGCCYGGICEPPQFGSSWAVTFPADSPPYQHQIENGDLQVAESQTDAASSLPPRSRPVHPTQIYSSINAALICLLLIAVYPYRTRDGQVIALMLTIYPITRFLLEIIRKDESAVFGSGMSISQNVSIAIILGIVAMWIYVLRSRKPLAFPPV